MRTKLSNPLWPAKATASAAIPSCRASVPGEAENVLIKNGVIICVVACCRHLGGHGVADCISDSLAERSGGGFDSGSLCKFRVTGRSGVELAKVFDLFDGQVESGNVKPAIQKHAAMTAREDESIPIEPLGLIRVVLHGMSVENCSHFCRTEWQSEVTGTAGMNGIDGETAGFVGCLRKNRLIELAHEIF